MALRDNIMMLAITIDISKSIPLYQQISDALLLYMASGQLKPGEKLPTVRQLAADLDVNMNTVAAAYKYLESLHLVAVKRGSGVEVIDGDGKVTLFKEEAVRNLRLGIALLKLAGVDGADLDEEMAKITASFREI